MFRIRLATALRDSLRDYNAQTLRADLSAGLVVSLIALPLSMALSIAVGLPPQHGLYTAIVAGIAAALLGGSPTQVSGPTAAFVVIIAPIVSELGLSGLIWCQLLAGVFLLAMGIARLGRFIHYVPYTVTTGFTAGIAVTIATLALGDFLGLPPVAAGGHYHDKVLALWRALPQYDPAALGVAAVTLATVLVLPRIAPRLPAAAIAVAAGTLLSLALSRAGMPVDTLLTRFSYADAAGVTHGGIPAQAPLPALPAGAPDLALLKTILMPSLLIAALAALESLLSATVADRIAHTRHDPDAELNGIGAANILSGFFGGIPATGAIARTAANIHSGARTPVAAVIHSLLLLVYMMTLAPYISHIPMAALAALLVAVAWRMSHARQFAAILRVGTRAEKIVLVGCFVPTVLVDMVAGVTAGMLLAALFLRHSFRAADTPENNE